MKCHHHYFVLQKNAVPAQLWIQTDSAESILVISARTASVRSAILGPHVAVLGYSSLCGLMVSILPTTDQP